MLRAADLIGLTAIGLGNRAIAPGGLALSLLEFSGGRPISRGCSSLPAPSRPALRLRSWPRARRGYTSLSSAVSIPRHDAHGQAAISHVTGVFAQFERDMIRRCVSAASRPCQRRHQARREVRDQRQHRAHALGRPWISPEPEHTVRAELAKDTEINKTHRLIGVAISTVSKIASEAREVSA